MIEPPSTQPVPPELEGASLAAAVRTVFAVSWGRARAWIEGGKITVDGERCLEPRQPVSAGALLQLHPNAPRPRPLLDLIESAIVHLDAHLVVLAKPPGINTVPFDEDERDTLVDLVPRALARLDRRSGRRRQATLGIVHRLDRETSGLLVFVRSWLAKVRLSEQFREHTVKRHYLALAHGAVLSQSISSHLLRDRGDGLRGSRERAVGKTSTEPAKRAVTHVEVVEPLAGATLIRCRLETGRTHQIRIHLGELGHPLLGERAYVRDRVGDLLPAPRLMLHAAELGFEHPASKQTMHWELPPPADMLVVLERLRRG